MTTAATRAAEINKVEGFNVAFKRSGVPVDSGEHGLAGYASEYKSKLSGDKSVSDWMQTRFSKVYPGLTCTVYFANGDDAHGNTKLQNVRDSYSTS